MLKVQTYLDRSAVHGTGLFAKQAIKRGTVVWRLDTRCDRLVSEAEYEAMLEPLQCELFEPAAESDAKSLAFPIAEETIAARSRSARRIDVSSSGLARSAAILVRIRASMPRAGNRSPRASFLPPVIRC